MDRVRIYPIVRILRILFLVASISCFADYTLQGDKRVDREYGSTQSVQEQYNVIMQSYETKAWKKLEKEAKAIVKDFASSPFTRDTTYFLGVAYFHQDSFELANIQLTEYLTHQAAPKYFEEAIQYKFEIAEKFRDGARKHLMGFQSMPKWAPAGAEAVEIYDEVISALPHHDLAAHALFGKAQVQAKREDYRAGIESYQTLIRRFPKHPLAVESYVGISEIYLIQSQAEYPDPDFLDLAELNMRKFRTSFPGEGKLGLATGYFNQMRDYYAASLFETARFYERTNKWGAAKIYYSKILKSYPESKVADESRARFQIVEKKLAEIEASRAKSKK